MDCRGGSIKTANGTFLNPFGEAFAAEGYAWTIELCEADSDGDGATNGQELGDPCCVWKRGAALPQLPQGYRLSHPGFPQDTTSSEQPSIAVCNNQRALEADNEEKEKARKVATFFAPGEERFNLTMRCASSACFRPQRLPSLVHNAARVYNAPSAAFASEVNLYLLHVTHFNSPYVSNAH